jgi:hypothetical protein
LTTRCPTVCDDDCELGPAGCHERHLVATQRDHDPGDCERRRAAGIITGATPSCPCCGGMAFSCPCCGMVSHSETDAIQGYCGRCAWWTGDPLLGPPHLEKQCRARETLKGPP